jgi:hypothetical protein
MSALGISKIRVHYKIHESLFKQKSIKGYENGINGSKSNGGS